MKNNVELICSIGELAALFEKSGRLTDFLQTVVETVAGHMKADVCSIYLYDESCKELLLRANIGLRSESIGKVKLRLGEGLTGLSLKELRPICEGRAQEHPAFKFFPNIEEEQYHSFLAVPILRGTTRVGALVVQQEEQNYFTLNDVRALQAIAAQLATTIENANLLLNMHRMREELNRRQEEAGKPPVDSFMEGKGISAGIALGRALVLGRTEVDLLLSGDLVAVPRSAEDFERALANTEKQIRELQREMDDRLSDVASLIFSAHLLMLKDQSFAGAMHQRIEDGVSPQEAIIDVVNQYIHIFSQSENPRMKEKVQDIKDLGQRLLQNLVAANEDEEPDYHERIIVATDLLPSDILKLSAQKSAGIVLTQGTASSHVAILARALDVPTVIMDEPRLLSLQDGTDLVIDANQGNLHINPHDDVRDQYRAVRDTEQALDQCESDVCHETHTADGKRIQLLANINLLSEVDAANRLKAEGIGLYRSEIPFVVRDGFPSEQEQYRVYRTLIETSESKDITFRTLDIGGDKMLSYFASVDETNPFLGLRAIRFSLRNKGVFGQQLRALLTAGHDIDLKIMFPLVASVDDFIDARDFVFDCMKHLESEGVPYNRHPRLGVMVELPSAVEVVEDLAREADFLSVGSNDLVQYMLAVDRTNAAVSDLYRAHHPAVLRALKQIAHAAIKQAIPFSLCGGMATDERMLPFLIGIGFTRISMDVRSIPRMQKQVMALKYRKAKKQAAKMLAMSLIRDVEEYLEAISSEPS